MSGCTEDAGIVSLDQFSQPVYRSGEEEKPKELPATSVCLHQNISAVNANYHAHVKLALQDPDSSTCHCRTVQLSVTRVIFKMLVV